MQYRTEDEESQINLETPPLVHYMMAFWQQAQTPDDWLAINREFFIASLASRDDSALYTLLSNIALQRALELTPASAYSMPAAA